MFVEIIDKFVKIKEGDVEDHYLYCDSVSLTRVKFKYHKLPRGFEESVIKDKIIEVFGECGDFELHDFPGGFVFSYIERYPHNTDYYSVFPEERHVYQGLFRVFDIKL